MNSWDIAGNAEKEDLLLFPLYSFVCLYYFFLFLFVALLRFLFLLLFFGGGGWAGVLFFFFFSFFYSLFVKAQSAELVAVKLCTLWIVSNSYNSSFSSAVDQPCLDPQSTCCQELGGAAQVFCCSPQLVGGRLILWPWLVSVATRWDSPGGCGGLSVPLPCNHRVQSPWCQFAWGALAGQCPVGNLNIVVCSCLAVWLTGSVQGL